MKKLSTKTYLFLALNAFIGCSIIYTIIKTDHSDFAKSIRRDTSENFVFTSPILDCENVEKTDSDDISYKKVTLESDALAKQYQLSEYAVYFRDLNNGPWIGINEKAFFSPASLMKTPLLIAFLKQVERRPELLKKEVVATQEYFDYAIKQNFELQTKIIKGNVYTLEQVANLMITESDNVATLMLSKYVDQDDYIELLHAIGVTEEKKGDDIDIRVKDFAGFFRVLYNASYLNRDMSEFALSMLSKSTFESGIVAGVPKNTVVAHKYGERSLEQKRDGGTSIQERQFHDCGIIYTKKSPYILCIMTRGKDFKKEEGFIADMSAFVYKEFSK